MLTPHGFDPVSPAPGRTLSNVMATGEGRAASSRLYLGTFVGIVAAVTIISIVPSWWVAAMPPTILAAFCAWGLAAQKTHVLDVRRRQAPALRTALRVTRFAAITIGIAAAVAGAIGFVVTLLGPV